MILWSELSSNNSSTQIPTLIINYILFQNLLRFSDRSLTRTNQLQIMKVFTALVFLAVLALAVAATATVSKDKEVNGTVPSGSPQMPVPPQHARDARYYGYYGGYYPSYGYYWG